MKVTSVLDVFEVSGDVGREEKPLFSACSNVTTKSIRKSFLIAPKLLSRELSGDGLALKASFTQMGGEAMTVLSIWGTRNTFVSNILITNSPASTRISTE